MLAWAFDEDEPLIWEPRLGPIPKEVCRAIQGGETLAAWNAAFERTIFEHVLHIRIPYHQWEDPSTYARYLSLPKHLQEVSDILKLGDDGKDKEGKRLIQLFSIPASMGGEVTLFGTTEPYFREPEKHPEDWEKFKSYCRQDVIAERRIMKELSSFSLPPTERKIWLLDQEINETGIPVNREFVRKAYSLASRSKQELGDELKAKTGVENPNSRDQMLAWLQKEKYPYSSLEKSSVQAALSGDKITPLCREILLLRKEAARNSYKKLETLMETLSDDDLLRHQFVYLGAARTGRFSGQGFQFQNQPRPIKEVENDLDRALSLIDAEDYETIKKEYPSVIGMTVSCIRSAFSTPAGKQFVVCDLSAIENRVLGWLSGCYSILEVFEQGLDPYISFAVRMYNQAYEELLKDKPKRQISKPAVLGCGFGLGSGVRRLCRQCRKSFGFANYCKKCKTNECTYEAILVRNKHGDMVKTGLLKYAEDMGVKMTPQQAFLAQRTFRQSYPEVVAYWPSLEEAAKEVIAKGGEKQVGVVTFDTIETLGQKLLRILLPSGRYLHYIDARIETRTLVGDDGVEYERETIVYDGIGHGVGTVGKEEGGKGPKWGPVYTYGGKLCENIVQSIARDILTHGMLLAAERGAQIVAHAHDEIICVSDDDGFGFGLEDLRQATSTTPDWAPGLPLAAEGYTDRVYRKN